MWIIYNGGIINSHYITHIYTNRSGATMATTRGVEHPVLLSSRDIIEPLADRLSDSTITLDLREEK